MLPIIRYLLLIVIFSVGTLFIIKILKNKNILKSKKLIYIVFAIVILEIARIPIENLFFKYDSTDKAFFYLGHGEFLGLEEGENSCLLISNKDSKNSYIYLRKENGYFSSPFFQPQKRYYLLDEKNRTSVSLFKEENTTNYYVIIFTTSVPINKDDNYITDINNTFFHRIKFKNKDINDYFYLYSAYVENIDEHNYYIKINDDDYKVFD